MVEMNDLQLYEFYKSINLRNINYISRIYPKWVVLTGYAFCPPHPHRHYTLDEFLDVLYSERGEEFKDVLLNGKDVGEIYQKSNYNKGDIEQMFKLMFDKNAILRRF